MVNFYEFAMARELLEATLPVSEPPAERTPAP
jgi:hypothetical protein